jgi:hypothetical protein
MREVNRIQMSAFRAVDTGVLREGFFEEHGGQFCAPATEDGSLRDGLNGKLSKAI